MTVKDHHRSVITHPKSSIHIEPTTVKEVEDVENLLDYVLEGKNNNIWTAKAHRGKLKKQKK